MSEEGPERVERLKMVGPSPLTAKQWEIDFKATFENLTPDEIKELSSRELLDRIVQSIFLPGERPGFAISAENEKAPEAILHYAWFWKYIYTPELDESFQDRKDLVLSAVNDDQGIIDWYMSSVESLQKINLIRKVAHDYHETKIMCDELLIQLKQFRDRYAGPKQVKTSRNKHLPVIVKDITRESLEGLLSDLKQVGNGHHDVGHHELYEAEWQALGKAIESNKLSSSAIEYANLPGYIRGLQSAIVKWLKGKKPDDRHVKANFLSFHDILKKLPEPYKDALEHQYRMMFEPQDRMSRRNSQGSHGWNLRVSQEITKLTTRAKPHEQVGNMINHPARSPGFAVV